MAKLKKHTPLTKSQLADKMRNIALAKRLRVFVKDKFFPALCTASTSIDDAKYLLGSFSNMVMEQFLAQMKAMKFKDLKLEEKLDDKSPQYVEYKKLLDLFAEEDVFYTRELIEGMKGEIEMLINDELKARKLETLKTNFYES